MEHKHENKVLATDGSCPACNRTSVAVDRVLARHTLVVTETGFTFDPPLNGQELLDEVN